MAFVLAEAEAGVEAVFQCVNEHQFRFEDAGGV